MQSRNERKVEQGKICSIEGTYGLAFPRVSSLKPGKGMNIGQSRLVNIRQSRLVNIRQSRLVNIRQSRLVV